ncbi:uncharacterized protein LOC128679887 isoform X2 [Plodia interpunctella]|uniref:uncharacterized protein LOC128679887 isoform X2 n=1 Tax=Plodia interpunctella TaxID=58824 RepID=UPI0023687B9A|nr:uncharacterized protein LOC128679887 isoform X2 [Plodia interpunctella]
MPRTKKPAKHQEKKAEEDEAYKKFNKLVIDQKNKIDQRTNMELRTLEITFKILLGSLSAKYLQMTVGQLKNELHLKEVTNTRRTRNSTRSASHDDAVPSSSSRWAGRRSRSADAAARKPPSTAAKAIQRRRSRSVYRTPAYNKNAMVNYPAITPKVNPQTPLTILRQPRQGEMVVSMSGSPVMVPSVYTMQPEEKANCNILLQDGTMLSLQPKQLQQTQDYIPYSLMDSNVLNQLKILRENLDKVVKFGEKKVVK